MFSKCSLIVIALCFLMSAQKGNPPSISALAAKAIREAENLSLIQNRAQACVVLSRALLKADKKDQSVLKEKLSLLAKYFYTDKGFQAYVVGKDLFKKMKFSDALEKFTE